MQSGLWLLCQYVPPSGSHFTYIITYFSLCTSLTTISRLRRLLPSGRPLLQQWQLRRIRRNLLLNRHLSRRRAMLRHLRLRSLWHDMLFQRGVLSFRLGLLWQRGLLSQRRPVLLRRQFLHARQHMCHSWKQWKTCLLYRFKMYGVCWWWGCLSGPGISGLGDFHASSSSADDS